jgi:hypothetical protein
MDWVTDMTEHKNIHVALCAAQAGMGKVTKGSTNPAFKSKYANLADVVSIVIPALSEQGIAMYHTMIRDELWHDYANGFVSWNERNKHQLRCASDYQ